MDTVQTETDEHLAARARGGEESAFAALVRRYEQPLYAYARRLLGQTADAEDVFQETFLRVFQHLDLYDTARPFRPWLYQIATNLCRDRLRYRMRRPTLSLDASPVDTADARATPRARATARERAARLETALAALSPKHREVFLLARYEGLSYEEVAETLDIPVGTVKSRMNTAVGFLMKRMQDE